METSLNWKSIFFFFRMPIIGDKRIRTADICRAKAALYQLSYTPRWAIQDLNLGPHPYQGCALTNWANSPERIKNLFLSELN